MTDQKLDDILGMLGKDFDTIAGELGHSPEEAREVVKVVLDSQNKTAIALGKSSSSSSSQINTSDLEWGELKMLLEKKYSVGIIDSHLDGDEKFSGMFGNVELSDGRILPFLGDTIFESVGEFIIEKARHIKVVGDIIKGYASDKSGFNIEFSIKQDNGIVSINKDNGDGSVGVNKPYANWDDLKNILQSQYGIIINNSDLDIHTNNGHIWGTIILHGTSDMKVPFIGTKLLPAFGKSPVKDSRKIFFDGLNLVGEVMLGDGEWYEFRGDNLIASSISTNVNQIYTDWNILEKILENKYGVEIISKDYNHVNGNNTGNLFGHFVTDDGISIPFVGDVAYFKFGTKHVANCKSLKVNSITCDIYGHVKLNDGVWYEFSGEELGDRLKIYSDWNDISSTIEKAYRIMIDIKVDSYFESDGRMSGRLKLSTGSIRPFQGNRLFNKFNGMDIKDCANIATKSNGLLSGEVILEDGLWYEFEGDTITRGLSGMP